MVAWRVPVAGVEVSGVRVVRCVRRGGGSLESGREARKKKRMVRKGKRSPPAAVFKREEGEAVDVFPARSFRTDRGIVAAAVGADGAVMAARSATPWVTE